MTEDERERFEWGELERDAERTALFTPVGSWRYRILMWVSGQARKAREEIERDIGVHK